MMQVSEPARKDKHEESGTIVYKRMSAPAHLTRE